MSQAWILCTIACVCATAVAQGLADVPPTCAALKNNTCMKGSTSYHSVKQLSSATMCCEACYNDTKCAAFTYKNAPRGGTSCLFHPQVSQTNAGDCVSANIVRTPTPPPSPPPPPPPYPKNLKNVLHIIVDDLRPTLGAYGVKEVISPHFDKLAARSMIFERAYVQVALCGPSRTSFLTGRRPDVSKTYDFADQFREIGVGDKWWPLPQVFREGGHLSLGCGKVYHPSKPPNFDGSNSWSPEALAPNYFDAAQDNCNESIPSPYIVPASQYTPDQVGGTKRFDTANKSGGFSAGLESCPQPTTQDPEVADKALDYIALARASLKPFYLAVGLHKPHLPWSAPQEYYDLYPDLDNISVPKHPSFPDQAPPIAFHDNNGHPDVGSPWLPLPDNRTRYLRRAYMACVSFMDAQLGRILDGLDQHGLTESTAIIFHGDHGWQLGEHNSWRKMTVFELGTRVPLTISVPWFPGTAGSRSVNLVEMIDIVPTMVELAGLTLPTNETYDGVSLVKVLKDGTTNNKNSSFSQYPRILTSPGQVPPFPQPPNKSSLLWADNRAGSNNRSSFYAVGHSMRTSEWRYTEWVRWNASADAPAWDIPLVGTELYIHNVDTGLDDEAVNLAYNSSFVATVNKLSQSLRYFFRVAECKKTLCTKEEMKVALAAQGIISTH